MSNLNLNKVILGGRLTADPEQKQTPQGTTVCTFTIAVNRKGKDAPVDFIECVAWKNTAEFIARYFKKGNSICVEGEIQKRSYTDKNNEKRYVTEIRVNEAMFVDSKADTETPVFQTPVAPKFEEVEADEDLPF